MNRSDVKEMARQAGVSEMSVLWALVGVEVNGLAGKAAAGIVKKWRAEQERKK